MTNVVGLDFDYKTSRLYYTQIAPEAKIGWMVTTDPKANDHVILNRGKTSEIKNIKDKKK